MATTGIQREKLALAGMVRVDGLVARLPGGGEQTITARGGDFGRWDTNNGKLVFITIDGEIWLGKTNVLTDRQLIRDELADELCNANGRARGGAFVPCSNGEALRDNDILARLGNPNWMPLK
jgi:hypothetical protein